MNNTLVSPINTIGSHSVTPVTPQVLPFNLQVFWDRMVDLAVKEGYCFAQTEWWANEYQFTERYINRLFSRMVALGRLRIEKIPGSHYRKFIPIPLRRSRSRSVPEVFPKMGDTLYSTESASQKEQVTSKTAPVSAAQKEADGELVARLVSFGVWPRTAAWLARTFPERIPRAIAYFEAMRRARGKIQEPGAYLKACIVHNHGEGLDLSQVGKGLPPDPGRKPRITKAPAEQGSQQKTLSMPAENPQERSEDWIDTLPVPIREAARRRRMEGAI